MNWLQGVWLVGMVWGGALLGVVSSVVLFFIEQVFGKAAAAFVGLVALSGGILVLGAWLK